MHKFLYRPLFLPASLTLAILVTLTLLAGNAYADPKAALTIDPALEKHVLHLTEELRCLVCQNQTIADSHAELAIQLKNLVREKLAQGMSDPEIVDFMVQRYGDFVLYRPPVKSTTWALWFGPFLLLLFGLIFLLIKLRQPRTPTEPLTETDKIRVANLLADAPETKALP